MRFDVKTFWDGRPCADERLWGSVEVARVPEGLRITASLPQQPTPKIPDAPAGTRVANLWEYDVVECFLVGEKKYLEVELGAGGHFLVLDFTAPRVRDNEYEDFTPSLEYTADAGDGRWQSSIVIPNKMIPEGLRAANAFVIVGENYLCATPLPGPKPDFHQPGRFPIMETQDSRLKTQDASPV